MKVNEYVKLDATDLANLIKEKEITSEELMKTAINALDQINPKINAIAHTAYDYAKKEIANGLPDGPFQGVPFLIKESSPQAKGIPVDLGSEFGKGTMTDEDSNLMKSFKGAGLLTFGTTTTPEFAFSFSTEAKIYGPTRNPWNTDLSAGGSSGGAAAAVAGGIVPIAHANDGAGSIRHPAAVNGLVGLKPSRGIIPNGPRRGEILNGLSNEFVVTKSVRDSALLLDEIGGSDIGSRNWFPSTRNFHSSSIDESSKKLKIAWMDTPFNDAPVDSECQEVLYRTISLCEDLGHELVEDKPTIDAEQQFIATMRIWAANITRSINGLKQGLGRTPSEKNLEASNWHLYQYGLTLTAEQLLEAFEINNTVSRTVGEFFTQYDLILTPTISQLPWEIGRLDANDANLSAEQWTRRMMDYSPFTNLFNTTGSPAITLPIEESKNGLPIGMQFAGSFGAESTLFKIAGELERAKPWIDKRPNIL